MREPIDELRELASPRYRDDDLTSMVVSDAEAHGTTQRILDGELVLPTKQDAIHHRNRLLGITNATLKETQQQLTIQDLQKRLGILESQSGAPNAGIKVPDHDPLLN